MRQQTMGVIDYGATEAGVVILMIPAAILFLALQKYYVKGFMAGAVKGCHLAMSALGRQPSGLFPGSGLSRTEGGVAKSRQGLAKSLILRKYHECNYYFSFLEAASRPDR